MCPSIPLMAQLPRVQLLTSTVNKWLKKSSTEVSAQRLHTPNEMPQAWTPSLLFFPTQMSIKALSGPYFQPVASADTSAPRCYRVQSADSTDLPTAAEEPHGVSSRPKNFLPWELWKKDFCCIPREYCTEKWKAAWVAPIRGWAVSTGNSESSWTAGGKPSMPWTRNKRRISRSCQSFSVTAEAWLCQSPALTGLCCPQGG